LSTPFVLGVGVFVVGAAGFWLRAWVLVGSTGFFIVIGVRVVWDFVDVGIPVVEVLVGVGIGGRIVVVRVEPRS
jgi:hypothetical protein